MEHSLKARLLSGDPVLWINSNRISVQDVSNDVAHPQKVAEAVANWEKFAPLLENCFPELKTSRGILASDLVELTAQDCEFGFSQGRYFLKTDNNLPVAGSIKARGGIYEVCQYALSLALKLNLMSPCDPIEHLANDSIKSVFGKYTIAVGSTGNLGLSIGVVARALGFRAVVHMSSDAKPWKVERLRNYDVQVVQHKADYGTAVSAARAEADNDPNTYFVDDERSELLFYGYSAAASELRKQLESKGIRIDRNTPLFLYLPCGIGGAPGGIAYGIAQEFGLHAHSFFVEPAQSPCALVQLASGLERPVSVYDIGLTNKTEADGMAVAEVSRFVAHVMQPLLSGVYTVRDSDLFRWLRVAWEKTGQKLEPSAAAGLGGPAIVLGSDEGQKYLKENCLSPVMCNAVHVIWATGGSLVPDQEFSKFLHKADTPPENSLNDP
ncbi:D-serine ammonia-lyase [Ruegeria sp. SCP11]|uniref:D-serine ammonia-lyase n=1 Tax=Ruegeria sp. SCP11 TaxID=3141378 RepID=UPI00333D8A67